jgi:hypothetical protein
VRSHDIPVPEIPLVDGKHLANLGLVVVDPAGGKGLHREDRAGEE